MRTKDNGIDARYMLKKQKFDLVILDYKLTGLNGLSSGLLVLEELRQIKPALITIMISTFGNESVRAKAKEFGAYDFLDKALPLDPSFKGLGRSTPVGLRCIGRPILLDKPFNIDELVRMVKKSLNRFTPCVSIPKISFPWNAKHSRD